MSRVVPVYSILSLLLMGVIGGVYATNSLLAGNGPKSSSPDFTISTSPLSLSIAAGSQGTYVIALSSLNGFAGSVNVTAILSPAAAGAAITTVPNSVSLLTGSGTVEITIAALDSLAIGTYLLNITAINRQLSHSVTASLIVSGPKEFSLVESESSVTMPAGSSSVNTSIKITSLNGFSGNVTLFVDVAHGGGAGPKASLNVNRVTLASGQSQSAVLSLSAPNNPKNQTYTVTILATSGPLTQSVSVNVTFQENATFKQTPQQSSTPKSKP